jgi:hypothetical protein
MTTALLREPEALDVATRRQLAVAKIAEITGESAAKKAALEADKAKAELDYQRKRKIAEDARIKLAGIEQQLFSLGFSTEALVNRERRTLQETAPCIPETLDHIRHAKEAARLGYASREISVRDDQGKPLRTNDGRRPIEHVSNGGRINDFLNRAKAAEQTIEELVYSPLSPLEIEAAVDQILADLGSVNPPAPIFVDDQGPPVF